MDMLSLTSRKRMIRWRLRVLMAEKNINNKTLAEQTGIHPTTISRLKNTDELKQISGEVLDALCNVLECTPNDLIEFTPNNPPMQTASVVTLHQSNREKKKTSSPSQKENPTQAVA